jgi:hypothetical protein
MAKKTYGFEAYLSDVFARNTPRIPNRNKRTLVAWVPIISFVVGILAFMAAWSLWNWAKAANTALYYAGTMCAAYTGYTCPVPISRYSMWLWIGIILLATEGLLYLFAYPKLRDRKKEGWNHLYYGAIINVVYVVVSLFTSYDTTIYFIGTAISSVLGFYFLFQIRESYLDSQHIAPSNPSDTNKK